MIIGLTGENCSGKSTAAEHLQKKGFHSMSLSDAIRDALKEQNAQITREALIKKGNELRAQGGPGILGKKTVEKIRPDRNYVIDSIRTPEEVEELRKTNRLVLLYITAPVDIRFERIKKRNREKDPQTYESFLKFEALEMKNEDKTRQNLSATFEKADKKIKNDAGVETFLTCLDKTITDISKQFQVLRPGWDDYFMKIAETVAMRSDCVKRKVAAVIVKDKRIISTGYNGTPRGVRNCGDGGCPRCNNFGETGKNLDECLCSHGEENAIVQASYHGISITGSSIYTTYSPCLLCTKMIINAGIIEVIYNSKYHLSEIPLKVLKEARVKVRQHEI